MWERRKGEMEVSDQMERVDKGMYHIHRFTHVVANKMFCTQESTEECGGFCTFR